MLRLTFHISTELTETLRLYGCVKGLADSPTLTDRLRATPGAVVQAGPLSRANQTKSRLAAKTQQALGFKFLPSQPRAVGRHAGVSADSWTYTYLKNEAQS